MGKVTKRFQDAMRMMRAADPQRKEDGFQLLHEHVRCVGGVLEITVGL